MSHNNNNNTQEQILVTCRLLNANNYGSILANKKIVIAYCNVETNFKEKIKMFIGCFVNPADLALSLEFKHQQASTVISNNMYYFIYRVKLSKMFNVEDLLKDVIYDKSYRNDMKKFILQEKYPKIISFCESKVKEKLYNY